MTTVIKPDDLSKTVYKVGGYFEADGKKPASFDNSSIRGPNTPKTSSGQVHDPKTDVDKHFFIHGSNPLSFSLDAVVDPKKLENTKTLKFLPAGDTNKIIYLPYYQKNITSTVIPINDASVCYFITDGMSGCNFFIDKLPNGDLVCHHANALQCSPTEAAVKADAGAFNPLAPTTMDTQHRTALSAYPGAENVASLRVADYYAKAQASVDQKVKEGKSNVQFYGGTTIIGFRVAGKWEFWFQTYARVSYRITGIAGLIKGKGKDVKVEDAPQEIIDVQRFWPK